MLRAVLYCRVSSKEQVENFSLETQLKCCKEYCARQSLEVAEAFVEKGESAKTTDRTELKRLIAYCQHHKKLVQFVIVYNVSRLARDKHDYFVLRALFRKLGITLRSVTEPIDDSAPGKFIEGVLAAAAQFDNDVKADRTRAGMRAALELGRWTYQAPLGYLTGRRPGPSLVPDSDRSGLVQRAFELRANSKYDNARILHRLNALGLRTRKGRPVSMQTFAAMIRNPIYAGRIELSKVGFSGKGDWEPLVSAELFARAQRKRGPSKIHSRFHPDFPLRGFVRCALCSTPLTGSWSRGRSARYPYYSCRKCGEVRVNTRQLERLFMERLGALQPTREYQRLFNAIVLDVWKQHQTTLRAEMNHLKNRLLAAQDRLDSVERAFIFEKRIDQATYEDQRDRLRAEIALLEIDIHENRLDGLDVEGLLEFSEEYLADASRLWHEAAPDQKRQLQTVFFPEGLNFDGQEFGTAVTCLAFMQIQQFPKPEEALASPPGFEPGFWP